MGMTTSVFNSTPETVDSTSDQRTTNNVMRHEYRVLSDTEKADMQELKDLGAALVKKIRSVAGATTVDAYPLAIETAQIRAEESVMWAVKYITA